MDSSECPKCNGVEGEFYWVDKIEYWRDCECVLRIKREQLIKSSQITTEFTNMSFANFDTSDRSDVVKQAYSVAVSYSKDFQEIKKNRSNGLCLIGRPGAGKTHLLMATANNLLSRNIQVLYFPWVEGFADLKSSFDLLPKKIKQLQTVEVLYIDDLFKGRQSPTDFQLEQIFGIINYRYLNKLPILVSSEWTIARICEFDEATGSRINEMCRDHKVVLSGGIELNYRLR
ncbi:hypothetical protein PMSD_20645 [Paenibacillus macquariensis subsp. defensor]|nr:hypothetical protein PMSD_20645 [Paenibacillus macquariensis subsp. defensor]